MTWRFFSPFSSSGNDPFSLSPLPILPPHFPSLFLPLSLPVFLVICLPRVYNRLRQDAFRQFHSLQIPNSP